MAEFFLVARVLSRVGKDGFVKIESFTDNPDRFFKLKKIFIEFFNDKKKLRIQSVKKLKNSILLKFENFNSDNDVDVLVGKDLFINDDELLTLPDNQAYIHDIIGSIVLKNNVKIGEVVDILILKSNNVYVIKENNNNELLIPAIADYVERFDSKNRILILKPIDKIYDEDDEI